MKIVITGGAGFLGYHLCRLLVDKCEEIRVLDIVNIDRKEYGLKVKYFCVDVRNFAQLDKHFKGIDVVIHAAAALPLWEKKDIFDINVNGTRNVLEAAKCNKIKRVIFISSTAVYGIPKEHPLYEDSRLIGVGPYGESKIQAERLCQDYRSLGMHISIVRPKSFIGAGRLGVFEILYNWIESGKRIPIIGNGQNHYQLLEVEDLVDAIYLLMIYPGEKTNDNFNIGAEQFSTVLEDLSALCIHAGTKAKVMTTPAWVVKLFLAIFDKLRISPLYKWIYATADRDSFVSIDKIKKILSWAPTYSNKDALIRSYKWYLENKQYLGKIGITHRVAWRQGVLSLIKKFL